MSSRLKIVPLTLLLLSTLGSTGDDPKVDWAMVAKIREEGLQRSKVMDFESYLADVLGARLTLSSDMKRAQAWVMTEMGRIGLVNVAAEPFMDFGVTWDNEYVSVHMLEPDYSPMVGYPISHTPGTAGKVTADAMIVELVARADLEKYRGKLEGKAVLVTPPVAIDLASLTAGVPRLTDADLEAHQKTVVAPVRPTPARTVPNPDLLTSAEKLAFYKAEGVAAVLQCESGWLGACRGYDSPIARRLNWSAEGIRAAPPIIAITPEHYNRMYRILERKIAVKVELEVRNRIGSQVEKAVNIIGEIPGGDLAEEVVMIGAHFDTWHASPNASDNTSGVAVAMEAARILKAVGAKPRRTIRIGLWSGEEQGLFGSRAYVKQHFGTAEVPLPGYRKFSAYFNQDYGSGQYRGIMLQGNEHAREMLTAWMAPFRDLGMSVVSNQSLGSTDHVAFDEVGLPGFQFLQDPTPGQGGHTNLDFFDTIQASDLMKNAVVMASYAWHAAMAETKVPRKGGR
ncbi:MAG: M20/M25/M40 family metallo-hydrolase [Gemmatimonadales bacterium]